MNEKNIQLEIKNTAVENRVTKLENEVFELKPIPGCQDYKILDNPKRKASYATPKNEWKCDQTGYSKISPDWKGAGWYRFHETVGFSIPEETVEGVHCGVHGSGWLQDKHPVRIGETKNATVCFNNGSSGICNWSTTIKIRQCGSYYIYHLPDAPICHVGYCAE